MVRVSRSQPGRVLGGERSPFYEISSQRGSGACAGRRLGAEDRSSVYVVVGPKNGPVNDRVQGILNLRGCYGRLTLASGGARENYMPHVVAKPFPPATAILRHEALRSLRKGIERIVYFPSRHSRYARTIARRLMPRIKTDLAQGLTVTVLTCVPPHDVAIAGLMIKREYPDIRWVTDWQDLWSYDENYLMRIPRLYHGRLRTLEREIMDSCDLNVVTNRFAQDVLMHRFDQPKESVAYIHHHFDDFIPAPVRERREDHGPIRLGFLGTLFKPPRVPGDKLVEALHTINKSIVAVELHVHGIVPKEIERRYWEYLGKWLFFHGYAPHNESLNEISAYDALLLFLEDLNNSRIVMSIKLPAYFSAQRPIVAIVPERSANAEIVERSGMGFVLPVAGNWQHMLKGLIENWYSKIESLQKDENYIRSFTWKKVSKKWREALSETR